MLSVLWFFKAAESVSSRSVIIVCEYFSFIRSFTWLNFSSQSNSYHKTSLSMSFGCLHLSGIPLSPLHFAVYNSVTEEIRTAMSIHFKWLKGEIPATFITCILTNTTNNMHSVSRRLTDLWSDFYFDKSKYWQHVAGIYNPDVTRRFDLSHLPPS